MNTSTFFQNYKSCFKKRPDQIKKLDKRYEILNSSGLNFITWPQYSSIYMFKLKILDPNFRLAFKFDLSLIDIIHYL